MAESILRIKIRRGLTGRTPQSPKQIIGWLEAGARGWNDDPTLFDWGDARVVRRERSRIKQHALGGSGDCVHRLVRARSQIGEFPGEKRVLNIGRIQAIHAWPTLPLLQLNWQNYLLIFVGFLLI